MRVRTLFDDTPFSIYPDTTDLDDDTPFSVYPDTTDLDDDTPFSIYPDTTDLDYHTFGRGSYIVNVFKAIMSFILQNV